MVAIPYTGPFMENMLCGCKPTILIVDDNPFNIHALKILIYKFAFPKEFLHSYQYLNNIHR